MKKYNHAGFFLLAGVLLMVYSAAVFAAEPASFNPKQLKKVKAGMTRSEVTALVGKPGEIKKKPDGGEIWIYEHKKKTTRPPTPDLPYPQPEESLFEVRLKVVFDEQGVVLDTKRRTLKEKHHSYLVPPDHVEPVKVAPAEHGS